MHNPQSPTIKSKFLILLLCKLVLAVLTAFSLISTPRAYAFSAFLRIPAIIQPDPTPNSKIRLKLFFFI